MMDMLKQLLEAVPEWPTYLITFAVASLVSWVITLGAKRWGEAYYHHKGTGKPWWWRPGLRMCATVVGTLTGLVIGLSTDTLLAGVLIGLIGGGLSVVTVALVKAKLISKVAPGMKTDASMTWSTTIPGSMKLPDEIIENAPEHLKNPKPEPGLHLPGDTVKKPNYIQSRPTLKARGSEPSSKLQAKVEEEES